MTTATKAEPPLPQAQVAPAVSVPEPLKIDLGAEAPREKPPTKRYWLGVRLDAPFDNMSKGGVSFSKRWGMTEYEPDGSLKNAAATKLGDVLELTDDQVKTMMTRVAATFVRVLRGPTGAVTQCQFIASKYLDAEGRWVADPRHDPLPGDLPLGKFLYVMEVGDRPFHRETCPAPLVR